jgi:hypothetical protein
VEIALWKRDGDPGRAEAAVDRQRQLARPGLVLLVGLGAQHEVE